MLKVYPYVLFDIQIQLALATSGRVTNSEDIVSTFLSLY